MNVGKSENFFEKKFKFKERNTGFRIETLGGLTTFLTCVYIIAVNPNILAAAGMDKTAVFWATTLVCAIGCIFMGIYANFPLAVAPAMGLNAYFAYYVVGILGLSWQNALGCVLISGIVFTILSLLKMQQHIVNGVPDCIKHSIGAGIGFFIAFVGLSQSGIIQASPETLIQIGDLSNPGAILTLLGIALTAFLIIRRVKGAILIGIITITIAGFFFANPATGNMITQWPAGGIFAFSNPAEALAPTFGQLSFAGMFNNPQIPILGVLFAIFSFLFVDLFDGIAVLLGVGAKAGFLNEKGEMPGAGRALFVSATTSILAAILGTNTSVIYGAESTAGISEGARTGFSAIVTGLLFFLALLLAPFFLMIPPVATAPALVMIGIFMMEPLGQLNLKDFSIAFPVFCAVAITPFTYSIAHGIIFSILAYTISQIALKKGKDVSKLVWILTVVFLLYLIADIILKIMVPS